MNTLFSSITNYICQHNLIIPGSQVVIGLSGGPDSMFLLHYLHTLHKLDTITLIVAHLDHGWRTESVQDAQFCANIAADLGIPFTTSTLCDLSLPLKCNGSKEEIGRKARRYFLEQVRQQYNAHYIALAHHADDQQETFFIRLLRGASLPGLTAIKPRNGYYIRPLLKVAKSTILEYLQTHNIPFLIDSTNNTNAFLRNRIRNNVIPQLRHSDTRYDTNFMRTLDQLQQTEDFLNELTTKTFAAIAILDHEHYLITKDKFLVLHPVLQQRILIHWLCIAKVPFTPSQALLDEIMRFLHNNKGTHHTLYQQWRLVKDNGTISIVKAAMVV